MDELEKLFAEASASVKKATTRKEPEPAVPEPPAEEPAPTPPPQAVAPPPPPKPAAPAGPGGTFTVSSGQQGDTGLALDVEGTPRDVAYAGSFLALGRVGTVQVLGVRQGASLYLIPQDKVNFKGLVQQLQPDTVGNWRRLVVELAERIPSSDPGVSAITSGGGMIPKYATVEAFADQVRAGA